MSLKKDQVSTLDDHCTATRWVQCYHDHGVVMGEVEYLTIVVIFNSQAIPDHIYFCILIVKKALDIYFIFDLFLFFKIFMVYFLQELVTPDVQKEEI